jgi:hypothetical protein
MLQMHVHSTEAGDAPMARHAALSTIPTHKEVDDMSLQHKVSERTQRDTSDRTSGTRQSAAAEQPPSSPPSSGSGGGGLSRVTANFTPRAMASLERVSAATGDSRTDVLNMAVQVYETVVELINEGDGRTLRVTVNGEERILQFIG